MTSQDQMPISETGAKLPSQEVQTLRSGEPRETAPGHYEIVVESDVDRAIESQATQAIERINRLNIEGVPPELGAESKRSIELAKSGARESITEIINDEDIDAALRVFGPKDDESPKSYAAEAFAETIRPPAIGVEGPEIHLEKTEDFPELPNQGLSDALAELGLDFQRVTEIDKLLRSKLGNKYNENMTSNQVPAFITGFKQIDKALELEMSDAIILGLLNDLDKAIPKESLKMNSGSNMERRMSVGTALPDSWQTKEMRTQLDKSGQLDILADMQERIGNEKLKNFLSALPAHIVKNPNIMNSLFSKETGSRLVDRMNQYPDISTVPKVIDKLGSILQKKPYLIPRILSSASFPSIQLNTESITRGGAMQSGDTLEKMLNELIDTKPPIEEPVSSKLPADRRSLRETFRAAE